MSKNEQYRKLQRKYFELYGHPEYYSRGGIFKKDRRKQLLGLRKRPLKGQSKSTFWYHIRENVKNGLIDLQLFIEIAGEESINKVMNAESLEPIVYAFLFSNKPQNEEDVSVKAKVAQMLVEHGLDYLRSESGFGQLRKKEEQEIDDAIELSKQLAFRLLSHRERTQIIWEKIRSSKKKDESKREEK